MVYTVRPAELLGHELHDHSMINDSFTYLAYIFLLQIHLTRTWSREKIPTKFLVYTRTPYVILYIFNIKMARCFGDLDGLRVQRQFRSSTRNGAVAIRCVGRRPALESTRRR